MCYRCSYLTRLAGELIRSVTNHLLLRLEIRYCVLFTFRLDKVSRISSVLDVFVRFSSLAV